MKNRLLLTTVMSLLALMSHAYLTNSYYWFDQETTPRLWPRVDGEMQLNTDELADGIHTLYYAVCDDEGRMSSPVSREFYHISAGMDVDQLKLNYVIDGGRSGSGKYYWITTSQTPSGGALNLELDLTSLNLACGMHTIAVYLEAENGTVVHKSTNYFVMEPVGSNGIATYAYWVNNGDQGATTVTLENPTFNINTQCAVQSTQWSTDHFMLAFESDGTPIAINRDEIGFALTNAAGYTTFTTASYGDVRQKQAVEPVGDITGGGQFSHAVPASGKITWWKFTGAYNDSIAIKASRSSSLQLFAPDGTEIYGATGSGATTQLAMILTRPGVYYVAQHSATGTSALGLDFWHEQGRAMIGDVDGDGKVTIADVTSLIDMILHGDGDYQAAADVDADGKISIADVTSLIDSLLNGGGNR